MGQQWQQTGTNSVSPWTGLKCNSTTLATNPLQKTMSLSGSAGGAVSITLPGKASYTAALWVTDAGVGVTSLPAGTWNVKVNITTAISSGGYISAVYICRLNSSGVSQGTIASATGLSVDAASTGVKSIDVTQGSPVSCSSTDRFSVQVVFYCNSHAGDALGITSNQLITDTISTGSAINFAVNAAATSAAANAALQANPTFAVNAAAESSTGTGTGKNLWPNADLESGIDDWEAKQNCSIAQSTEQAWEQSNSLKMTPSNEFWHLRAYSHDCSGSTQYTLSLYLYSQYALDNGGWIYVYDQDLSQIDLAAYDAIPAQTWTRVTITFTTGAGDTGVRPLMTANSVSQLGLVYFDGIQLELGSSATAWENYGAGGAELTIENTVAFAVTAAATSSTASAALDANRTLALSAAAVSATADATLDVPGNAVNFAVSAAAATAAADAALAVERPLAVASAAGSTTGGLSKNLWENADLESGIDDWNGHNGGTPSWSTNQAWQGTHSVEVNADGVQYAGAKSDVKSVVESSTDYTLSCYVYPLNGSMEIKIIVQDQLGAWLANTTVATTQDAWTRRTLPFTTNPGSTGIFVTFENNNGLTGHFFVDGVQVETGSSATTWENHWVGAVLQANPTFAVSAAAASSAATSSLAVERPLSVAAAAVSATANATLTVPSAAATVIVRGGETFPSHRASVIDGSHPLAKDLIGYWLPSTTASASGGNKARFDNLTRQTPPEDFTLTEMRDLPAPSSVVATDRGPAMHSTGTGNPRIVTPGAIGGGAAWRPADSRNEWTFAMRVRRNATNDWDPVLDVSDVTGTYFNPEIEFDVDSDNGNRLGLYWGDAGPLTIDTGFVTVTGQWYDLVVTSRGGGPICFYVDGVLVYEEPTVTGNTYSSLSNYYLVIGSNGGEGAAFSWAYVAHWHRCLTAGEVAALHRQPYALLTSVLSKPGTGAAAVDFAANAAATTATGSAALAVERPIAVDAPATTTCADATLTTVAEVTFAVGAAASTSTASAALDLTLSFATTAAASTVSANASLTVNRPLAVSASAASTTASASLSVGGNTYYVRADGVASKANATDPSSASTSMNVTTFNSSTFSPGDTIKFSDQGGVFRWGGSGLAAVIAPSSGSSGSPITYGADGSPVIKGSLDLTSGSYEWHASGSGTNEFYVTGPSGADPGLIDPGYRLVFLDDTSIVSGTLGSLADHQWAYGDNDSLGFNTVYVRDDSGDPDMSGVVIEAGQAGAFYLPSLSYVVVDGIEARHGNDSNYLGGIVSVGGDHITVQNCEAHWNNGHGIKVGSSFSVVDACIASYNGVHNIAAGGSPGSHISYVTFKYNTSHHAREQGVGNYGYGLKFIWCDDSVMHNNLTYANEFQGVNIDGVNDNPGACRNVVRDNWIYGNAYQGVYVELHSSDCEVYRNYIANNGSTSDNFSKAEIAIANDCPRTLVHHNVIVNTRTSQEDLKAIYSTAAASTGNSGCLFYSNTIVCSGATKFGILIDGDISPQNTVVKNNIVVGTWDACLSYYGSSYTGFASDYNCFQRSGSSLVISRAFSGMTIATHCSSYSQDCNSVDADPQFHDDGYWVKGASPCRNAGTNLGSPYDTAVHRTSVWPDSIVTADQDDYGTGWDIGAFVADLVELDAIAAAATATSLADLGITSDVVFSVSAAAQSAAANAALAVERPLAVDAAGSTSTDFVETALDVERPLSVAAAGSTATADASLTVTGEALFAVSAAAQSATADAALAVLRPVAVAADAQTVTAGSDLLFERELAVAAAAQTATAQPQLIVTGEALFAVSAAAATQTAAALLAVERPVSVTAAASSTTASVALDVPKLYAVAAAAGSVTADAALDVERDLSLAAAAETTTAAGGMSIERAVALSVGAVTSTAQPQLIVTGEALFSVSAAAASTTAAPVLAVERPIAVNAASQSQVASPEMALERALTVAAAGVTQTTTPALAMERSLSVACAAASLTSEPYLTVTGETIFAVAAAATSITSEPFLVMTRDLSVTSSAASAAVAAALQISRPLAVTAASVTTTAAPVLDRGLTVTVTAGAVTQTAAAALGVVRSLAAAPTGVTATSAAVLLAIRELSAALNAVSALSNPVLAVDRPVSVTASAVTATAMPVLALDALGDIIDTEFEQLTVLYEADSWTVHRQMDTITAVRKIDSM